MTKHKLYCSQVLLMLQLALVFVLTPCSSLNINIYTVELYVRFLKSYISLMFVQFNCLEIEN